MYFIDLILGIERIERKGIKKEINALTEWFDEMEDEKLIIQIAFMVLRAKSAAHFDLTENIDEKMWDKISGIEHEKRQKYLKEIEGIVQNIEVNFKRKWQVELNDYDSAEEAEAEKMRFHHIYKITFQEKNQEVTRYAIRLNWRHCIDRIEFNNQDNVKSIEQIM